MRPTTSVSAITLAAMLAATGCVDRRLNITSEPPGALVHLNDQEVGRTPLFVNFTWFGTYDVRLSLEGYETLSTAREAKAPLHEQPGIDLIVHALPVTSTTHIDWHFDLTPKQIDTATLIKRGHALANSLPEPPQPTDQPTAPTTPSATQPDSPAQLPAASPDS